MAKFTSTAYIDQWWRGIWEFNGPAGTEFSIPDSLYSVFNAEMASLIPGLTWTSTVDIPTLPIAESDVTGLASDLAGKAAAVHTHAESSITSLTTDLASKIGASGGTVTGQIDINGAAFSKPYDTDLWIAGTVRSNSSTLTQGIYVQHRIKGSANSHVMDAAAFEIRLDSISNATFLNAIEASYNVTGGVNSIANGRCLTANVNFSGSPTGTLTNMKLIVAQAVASQAGFTITNLYGLYVENQIAGTTNWSIYAPTGSSHFGIVETEGKLTVGDGTAAMQIFLNGSSGAARDIRFQTAGVDRWYLRIDNSSESGSQAGSDLQILSRSDAGGANFTHLTLVRKTGDVKFGNVPLGFFGGSAASKQTVTGSKGANAALTSLLTALAAYGLITDSTT